MTPRHGSSSRHGAPPSPDLFSQSERENHWTVFKGLLPFVWPEGRPDLRRNVVLAFRILVLAKFVTVGVPVIFK